MLQGQWYLFLPFFILKYGVLQWFMMMLIL
jgi:hypothetical protein